MKSLAPLDLITMSTMTFSNHRSLHYFINQLFRRRSKKTTKLRVTSLCEGNPLVTGGFIRKGPVRQKKFPFVDVSCGYNRYHDYRSQMAKCKRGTSSMNHSYTEYHTRTRPSGNEAVNPCLLNYLCYDVLDSKHWSINDPSMCLSKFIKHFKSVLFDQASID